MNVNIELTIAEAYALVEGGTGEAGIYRASILAKLAGVVKRTLGPRYAVDGYSVRDYRYPVGESAELVTGKIVVSADTPAMALQIANMLNGEERQS